MLVTVKPSKNTARVNDLLVVSKQQNKNLSKKMVVYFFILQYVFLLDFGFFEPKTRKGKLLKKIWLISASVIISVTLLMFFKMYFKFTDLWWWSASLAKFVTYVSTVAVSNVSLQNLFKDLDIIDDQICVDSRTYGLEIKLIFVTALFFLLKCFTSVFYCFLFETCDSDVTRINSFLIMPLFAMNIGLILFFFVFYCVYCRLKKFTEFIRNFGSKIVLCEFIYKSLLDSTENAKKGLDRAFALELFFHVPSVMVIIYRTLSEIKSSQHSTNTYWSYISIFEDLILLFAPAFAAGWLYSQVERIKLILHDALLDSTGITLFSPAIDPTHSQDIVRFLRYIEARPFKFSVHKIIPLDYTLPIIVLNMCVTYLIVIIQLTHLY